jgi:ribonuclease J
VRVCIHRGTREIGGTCVEIEAQGQRLVLDIGLPLNLNLREVQLPPVKGFAEYDPTLLGVVISHPHQDHYGLAGKLPKKVRILIGTAAESILKAALPFFPGAVTFQNVMHLDDREQVELGPFKLTPYSVDHSAYDSYSVLVEADGKRLFYSGDFRAHGRTGYRFRKMLRTPPQDVDVLLLEGTLVGQDDKRACKTEDELVPQMVQTIKATEGLVLACCSGQNIDRLVTIFKAARRAGRQLIIDGYTAYILKATGNRAIPQSDWGGIQIFWPNYLREKMDRKGQSNLVDDLAGHRISAERIAEAPCRAVMLFRTSMMQDLEQYPASLIGASLIYSLWPGYLEKDDARPFLAWLKKHCIPRDYCHTSGHATVKDLQALVAAIKPSVIIPIHTSAPGRYKDLFDKVMSVNDGAWWNVQLEGVFDMNEGGRKHTFKIGQVHGKLTPDCEDAEQKMRNDLFLAGRLEIVTSRKEQKMLRIIGYEIPLVLDGPARRNCADLLAYDQEYRPYLVELKRGDASDKPDEVIRQVQRYAQMFDTIRTEVQKEVREVFLWPKFSFCGPVQQVILAPKSFYTRYKKEWIQKAESTGILLCYFPGRRDMSQISKTGIVGIHALR